MNRPLLSLIIPMYNAAGTIATCLESLLAHAGEEVEILVVDDGSLDDGAALVRQAFAEALASGRLLLLQQPNRGVSAARNLGLEHARGAYLGFADADDAVLPHYFSTLLPAIRKHDCDIAEFGFAYWDGQFPAVFRKTQFALGRFGDFPRPVIEREVFGESWWYAWSRLFRRELFDGLRFPEDVRFCEDMMVVSQAYRRAGRIRSLPEVLYLYRENPAGATRRAKPDYVDKLIRHYLSLLDVRDDCTDLLKVAMQYCIYSCLQSMGQPYRLDPRVEHDLGRIRRRLSLYRYMPSRRRRILLLPRLSRWLSERLGRYSA